MSENESSSSKMTIVEDAPRMRSMAMVTPLPVALMRPSTQAFAQKQSAPAPSPVATPVRWNPAAVTMPVYYQVERTSLTISNSHRMTVAQRIEDCCRLHSMAGTFHDSEARVEVITPENVHFSVRLWQASPTDVLVEVQRASGCCFLYQQAARTVLKAAKGMACPKNEALPLPKCLPKQSEQEREADMQEGLDIACSMLKQKHRMDAHLMALESLVQLSGACQVSRGFCAKAILNNPQLMDHVVSVLTAGQHERHVSDVEEQHLAMMHRNALTVLANCLEASSSSTQKDVMLPSEDLLSALVNDVRACSSRPHDATLAAKVLQLLVQASPELKARIEQMGCGAHVQQAKTEGQWRHSALQQAAHKLQLEMQL